MIEESEKTEWKIYDFREEPCIYCLKWPCCQKWCNDKQIFQMTSHLMRSNKLDSVMFKTLKFDEERLTDLLTSYSEEGNSWSHYTRFN